MKKVLLVLALLVFAVGLAISILKVATSKGPGSNVNSASSGHVGVGSTGVLRESGVTRSKDETMVPLAVDEGVFGQLVNALLGGNDDLVNQLIRDGRVFTVPSGSRVLVLNELRGDEYVQVTDAPASGLSNKVGSQGWVLTEWVTGG